jgi:hypothetical protein
MHSMVIEATFAVLLLGGHACGDPGQHGGRSTAIVPMQPANVTPQVIQAPSHGETEQAFAAISQASAPGQTILWDSTDSMEVCPTQPPRMRVTSTPRQAMHVEVPYAEWAHGRGSPLGD